MSRPDRIPNPSCLAVLLIATSACGAGIEDRAADIPALELVPEMRVDGHEEDLVPIAALAAGPDGQIAFAQHQDGTIRFFDGSGRAAGSFGRSGQGPGEFQSLWPMGWIGDTLWVWDGAQDRLTLIRTRPEPDLERVITYRETQSVRPPPEWADSVPEFRFVTVRAWLPDGSIVGESSSPASPIGGFDSENPAILRVGADGVIQRILLRYFAPEAMVVMDGGASALRKPFAVVSVSGVARDGSRAAAAVPSVDGPDAGTFRVVMVDAVGDVIYDHRYPFRAEPIPENVADSAMNARLDMIGSRDLAAQYSREASVPPVYPPLGLPLVVGRDGSLWIPMRSTDVGRPYLALDASGDPIGTLVVPPGAMIRDAEAETVWVTVPDELGVESVVTYAVRPAATLD